VITLDAGVVIAHLSPTDAHHRAATAYLVASADEDFVIHCLNLAEVLVGGVRTGRGQELLTDVEQIGIHVADRPPGESLRLANLRATLGLKMPDCCALDTALHTGSTLDESLANAARQRRVTVAPNR
jgi:predicted nucleic acid-binding protein